MGIGYLQITDIKDFRIFGQNYKLINMKENDYKTKFESTMPSTGTMYDYLKHFVNLLAQVNSGLTFTLGSFDSETPNSNIDWSVMQSNSSSDIVIKNCND